MPFYGLFHLSWWGYILLTLVLVQITIASITLFLHRSQAHRGLHLHPIVNHFFRFWLWMTTGIVTKQWVAIHRKHHAKCETVDDPHSPQVVGIRKVLLEGSELYRAEAKNQETLARYGEGTPDDWMERHVYSAHSAAGLLSMLLINLVLFGVPGIIIWAIQMAWSPVFAAGVINGVGHYWGYRNFDCADEGRNIVPWAFFIGGEELHNNHHAYPTSCKFALKPWEFDIGWLYIRLLSKVGLAQPKRVAPVVDSIPGQLAIEPQTLAALLHGRLHVMARYTKSVLMPAFKAELKLAKKQGAVMLAKRLRQSKISLLKEGFLLKNPVAQEHLGLTLQDHPALEQVYHFKTQLQGIWNRTSASQKELIDALHQWCTEAEKTGIKALREFSEYLKGVNVRRA